jgi:hypothetical protein
VLAVLIGGHGLLGVRAARIVLVLFGAALPTLPKSATAAPITHTNYPPPVGAANVRM